MSITDDLPAIVAPGLTIDGGTASAPGRIDVINRATAQVFVRVPDAGGSELDRAVHAAHRAARPWRARSLPDRQEHVLRLVALVRDHIDEFALLLTLEQGKPLANARGEIQSALRYCERYAAMQLPVEVVRDDAEERIEIRRVPVGVVGAITAWNYPLMLAIWKIAPALVAGNTVIVKPSPYTPVATLRLGELAQAVLPPGVLQVLSGGDEMGRAITVHPLIGKISFTGSERTGKAIMASSSATLKRLTLELGGNDAGIVLDDADPAAIAAGLYWGGLSNCGPVCAGLKRLYVPEQLAPQLEEALAAVAATVVVGDGTHDGVDMGPIQNQSQLDRVESLVAAAQRQGAEVYFRGQAPAGPGYFHPVTLVRNARDEMRLLAEEQFGPGLPDATYPDVDDAVARANASDLGLGASVWSADEGRALEGARRLAAGAARRHPPPTPAPRTPRGGPGPTS